MFHSSKTLFAGEDRSSLAKYIGKDPSTRIFFCTLCGKSNNQKINVMNHVEGVHFPNTFQYSCQYCNKVHGTKQSLYLHMSRVHKNNK